MAINLNNLPLYKRGEVARLLESRQQVLARSSSKQSFLSFVRAIMPAEMQPVAHHMLMIDKLQALHDRKLVSSVTGRPVNGLLMQLPPGSAKSQFCSVLYPAWLMGVSPTTDMVACSHTSELADRFGRRCRNMIQSPDYAGIFPGSKVAADNQSAGRWAMSSGGEYFATGVSGSPTGRRADCLVGGTLVDVKSKGLMPIEDIKVGDYVKSFKAGVGTVYSQVVATRRSDSCERIRIYTAAGKMVECTREHAIYVDGVFKPAQTLNVGDILTLPHGNTAISLVESTCSKEFVYDLQVDETECFFANDILVHNCLLMDDLVKSREVADSKTERDKTWEWYRNDLLTRLKPNATQVLVMTRWHHDDIAGRILETYGSTWEVVKVPMLAEPGDILGRPEGGLLWPEWFTEEMVSRAQSDPRSWAALYQQTPQVDGGGDFKPDWLQYYNGTVDHRNMAKVMLVDPASSKEKTSDFTAIWVVGLGEDENYYVLDMVRDRLNLTERADMVFKLHRKWRPSQVRYERYGMMGDIDYLKSEMKRRVYRFNLYEVAGKLKKEERIRRLIPLFERGKVYLPETFHGFVCGEQRDLVEDFIAEEYKPFPMGKHDDMLDSLARLAEPNLPLPWPMPSEYADNAMSNILPFVPMNASMGY